MIHIYSSDGTSKAEVNKFSYNGTFMGECFLTTTITSPTPINFELGDYAVFRDEQFTLNYTPAKGKKARSGTHGEAFTYENIKLNSLADELTGCDFLDYVLNDNLLHHSASPTVKFWANSVQDLVDRLQANLNRLYTGTKAWKIIVTANLKTEAKEVSLEGVSCWEALALVNTLFGVNFIVRGRTIYVGTAGVAVGKVFGYGKGKGLYDIQQVTNEDAKIITRLRVYGSTRNMPNQYYNKLKDGNGKAYIPELYYAPELRLPDFPRISKDPYLDSPNIVKYGIREGSVFFNDENELGDIFPSLEGMTKQQLNNAGIPVSLPTGDNGNIDEILSVVNPTDDGKIPEDPNSIPKQFTIYLKDLGFNLAEKDNKGNYKYATGETMQVAVNSGMCTARKFDILSDGITKDTTQGYTRYKLVCNRVTDESTSMAYPNKDWKINAGDTFVLLGIDMPEVYIKAAAQRLAAAGKDFLSKNDKSQFTYLPKIDELFMARNPELGEKIKEGDILNFDDTDLNIDASVIIQTLKINVGDNQVPTYEITLSDKKVTTTVEKIQSSIDTLMSNKTGITLEQVKSMIASYGTRFFLSKLTDDETLGSLTVVGNVSIEKELTVHKEIIAKKNVQSDQFGNTSFSSGQFGAGFRIWKDTNNGQSYAEFDNLMIRREAIFNVLTIAEIKSVGGQILVSPANMYCNKLETVVEGYKCYFDSDNGRIFNQFAVNDQVICRKFNTQKMKYYWRRVVSIGTDFIVLSKTDCDGTGIPEKGDELIQFGNRTDTNRQSAIMISSYGSDAPSIKQYVGINNFNLTGKEVTVISPLGNKFVGQFEIKTGGTTQNIIDYTNETISKIQFGGRNYFKISNLYNQTGAPVGNIYPNGYGYNTTRVRSELLDLVEKKEYTISNPLNYYLAIQGFDSQKKMLYDTSWFTNRSKIQYTPKDGTSFIVVLVRKADNSNISIQEVKDAKIKIELGNKATDFSPAPEDIQYEIDKTKAAADKAQSDAIKAQNDANKANSSLADITNDNLLTPSEKQEVLKEWQIIQGEKPTVVAQAQTYSVSFSAYETAFNNLSSYITPLLADLKVNTTIVGTDFRAKFKAYYDAKIALLKLVTDKAKSLADAAQTTANTAQTAADQAKTLANTAQSTANTAKTNADTANNLLSDISSDSKLTASEKQSAKLEWDAIVSEYSKNIGQANTFGVVTTNYANAYNTLNTYITPLLSSLTTTSNITGTDFRAKFKAYYDNRTDLLNAIAKKAKDLANAAQTAANNAQTNVSKVESSLKVLDDAIKTKVSQTDYNSLVGRVSTTESSITQLSGKVETTVTKVESKNAVFKSYTAAEKPSVPYAKNDLWLTFEGEIKQSSVTRLTGSFVDADWKLTTKYTDDSAVNNLQIGGRNLVRDSARIVEMGGDGATTAEKYGFTEHYADLVVGETYTFSCKTDGKWGTSVGGVDTVEAFIMKDKSTANNYYRQMNVNPCTFTVPVSGRYWIRVDSNSGNIKHKFWNFQIEKGNKATDWTLAPEDIQAEIDAKNRTYYSDTMPAVPNGGHKIGDLWYKISITNGCYTTYRWNGTVWGVINEYVSKVQQTITDNSITNLVTKTGINNIGNGESLLSKINQTASEIKIEVGKEIKSQINDIQIGGRNLIPLSKIGGTVTGGYYGDNTGRVRSTGTGLGWRIQNFTQSDKGAYSVSFWVKGDAAGNLFFDICDQNLKTIVVTTAWAYIKLENLNVTNWLTSPYFGFIDLTVNGSSGTLLGKNLYISNFKVEYGTKCTAYTAAPEDMDASIDNIQVGGRNLLINSNFTNGFASWGSNGGTRTVEDDTVFGKVAKIVATVANQGIFQNPSPRRMTGKNYVISGYVKAVANMNVTIHHEGGTGAKTFAVTTAWQRFETQGIWNNGGSVCFYTGSAGTFYMANIQYEEGTKSSAWSPAPEDIPQIAGSALTLTENKISLGSKTIELKGTTIAQAIRASNLEVESPNKLSSLKVLTDGTFYAKGSKSVNESLTIDSQNQSIEFVSPRSEGYGVTVTEKTSIKMSSRSGNIEVRNDDASGGVSIMSAGGLFANKANQTAFSAATGFGYFKTAIAGLGFGNSQADDHIRSNPDARAIAGVTGWASNSNTTNPAPAYGGYFHDLKACGFLMGVRKIENYSSTYTYLNPSDSLIIGMSNQLQHIYLPMDVAEGRVVYLKQWYKGTMRIYPRYTDRLYDDDSENTYMDVPCGHMAMCVYVRHQIGGTRGIWLFSKFAW